MINYKLSIQNKLLDSQQSELKPEWSDIKLYIEGKTETLKEILNDIESGYMYKEHNEKITELEQENKALKDKIVKLTGNDE